MRPIHKSLSAAAIVATTVALAALLVACPDKSKTGANPNDAAIVEYQGGKITLGEFEKELKLKQDSAIIDTSDRVIMIVLNEMIEDRLIEMEAKKSGLDRDPDIEERVQEYRRRLIREEYIKRQLATAGQISRETLNKYYNDHLADYEEVRFRDILIRVEADETPDGIAAKRQKAEDILQKAKGGADFAALATENTDDLRFKGKGGDVGWVSLNALPSQGPLRKAIEGVQPGQVAPEVVADYSGFHVVMLLERKTVTFEKVEDSIKVILTQQNTDTGLEDLMKKLKADYKVNIKEGEIKKVPPGGLPEGHP